MADRTKETKETNVPLAQIAQVLEQLAPGADAARASALELLADVQAARAAGLERERTRMAEVAAADHPFLARLDQRIEAHQTFGKQAAEAAAQARAGVPKPDRTAWIVYGRVLDADSRPVAKGWVGLADEKGVWQRQWPTDETGADGSYELRLPIPAREPSAEVKLDTEKGAAPELPGAVWLAVLDPDKKKPLLVDSMKFTPRAGAVDFRDLTLPAQESREPRPEARKRSGGEPKRKA